MPGSDDRHVSVDEFLREERRAISRLEGDIGRDVVAKLDRVLVRDLIYGDATDEAEHRVLVSLRAGLDATLDPGAPRGRRCWRWPAARTSRSWRRSASSGRHAMPGIIKSSPALQQVIADLQALCRDG